jgi:hypothetical protein
MTVTNVIATPRAGGTAYSHYLSEQQQVQFINEPYKFANSNEIEFFGIKFGGNKTTSDCVIHSTPSQYLSKYLIDHSYTHNIILLERKDKWRQFLSYGIIVNLYNKYGFHNINFKNETVEIQNIVMQRIIDEWILFDLMKILLDNKAKLVYYEDCEIDSTLFQKNSGYENVTVSNIEHVKKCFDTFMKRYEKNT